MEYIDLRTSNIKFNVIYPRNVDPPHFIITSILYNGLATYVECTVNETPVKATVTRNVISYGRPTEIRLELLFISRKKGLYSCSISNSRIQDKNRIYGLLATREPAKINVNIKGILN